MATVTVTATPSSVEAKVTVTVAFANTAVTVAKVERLTAGQSWVTLRAGAALACTNGQATINDFEAPFDLSLIYRATQVTPAGTDTGTSPAVILTSNGRTWLKDPAYPTRNMALLEVTSIERRVYAARTGVFAVIDRPRPIVIAARRQDWTGDLKFTTATNAERLRMYDLLSRGQVLLLSTPEPPLAPYGVGSLYVYVGDAEEQRVSPVVTDPSRTWTLPLIVVDRPDGLPEMKPLKWSDVKAKYATWQDLINTDMTWNQLLESAP